MLPSLTQALTPRGDLYQLVVAYQQNVINDTGGTPLLEFLKFLDSASLAATPAIARAPDAVKAAQLCYSAVVSRHGIRAMLRAHGGMFACTRHHQKQHKHSARAASAPDSSFGKLCG